MTVRLLPGDIVVVKTGTSLVDRLIAAGEALWGQASERNHVAGCEQYPRGLEGRPGSVGYVDLERFMRDPHTLNNIGQRKTPEQRASVIVDANKMLSLKTDYDWRAICGEVERALGVNIPALYEEDWDGKGYPGAVICSSWWAFLYWRAGLKHPDPGHERRVAPSDWQELILTDGWHVA